MTKPDIVNHIADNAGLSKRTATVVLDTFVGTIQDSLGNGVGRIKIANLGTFRVLEKKARKGVNPRTGRDMTIPAMKVARFSPSKALRSLLNGSQM